MKHAIGYILVWIYAQWGGLNDIYSCVDYTILSLMPNEL